MAKQIRQPRGIRNNNPLNIRIGNTWLGEVPNPTDSEFEQFVSPFYGLRAAFVILRRYIRRYHRDTIEKIISAWAPASENDTKKYIENVSKITGIDSRALIIFDDREKLCKIVSAMAQQENGTQIDFDLICKAYDAA